MNSIIIGINTYEDYCRIIELLYNKCIRSIVVLLCLLLLCGCTKNNSRCTRTLYERHKFCSDTVTISGAEYEILNPYHEKCLFHLKGSMHNHTDNSAPIDSYGSGDPYFIASKFRDNGRFDFYSFTDHNFVTGDVNAENIIWMGRSLEDTQHHHLLVYNLPDNYEYQFISEDINEQIKYYHSIGAFVSYGHPDWSGSYQSTEKIASVEDIDFVEAFNTVEGGSERAYNTLLLKSIVMAFGTDDYHHDFNWDNPDRYFNKSYIIVNTNKRDRDAIWTSILKGNFYASTGAKMDISLEGSYILIKCNKESEIEIYSPDSINIGASVLIKKYDAEQNVKYKLTGAEGILWIRIMNSAGSAISQPFYIKKIINE